MAGDTRRILHPQPGGLARSLNAILRDEILVATNFPSAQAALNQAAGSRRAVFFPRGDWPVTTPLINAGCKVIGEPGTRFVKSGLGPCFQTSGAIPSGNGRMVTADAPVGARTLVLSSVAGLTPDSTVLIGQQGTHPDWPEGPDAFGEFGHIEGISGNTVTLTLPLRFPYTVAARPLGTTGAEVMAVTFTQGVAYEGIEIVMDLAGDGAAIDCMFADAPVFRDVRISRSPFAGILLTGCRDALIEGGHFRDFLSADDDLTGGFGYAVAEQGLNVRTQVRGIHVTRCRHGYTTMAGSPLPGRFRYGMPMDTSVVAGIAHDMKAAAWDTHPAGLGIHFDGCKAYGSRREALQIRAKGVRVSNFYGRDTQRGGILASHSNADDTRIDGAELVNTNLDPAYWGAGALHVHEADGLTVRGLHVEGCSGPAVYCRNLGVLDVTLRDVSVRNACQRQAGPAVVLAQQAATDRCTVERLSVDCRDGQVTNAIQWTGANFSPVIADVSARGISGADVAGPG